MAIPNWQKDIADLHDLFEAYFLGTTNDLSHVEAVLADDFTFVGPDANTTDRAGTLAALVAGHGHTDSLKIHTVDYQLLFTAGDVTVAEYTEVHELPDRTNRRRTTVVFSNAPDAPNGLQWHRVHETWIDRGTDA